MANLKNKTLYRLTYRVDGKVCFAEMHAKGDRLRSLFVPFKEAHRFEGWNNLPERMPDSDLVIDGSFTPLLYELTYLIDGAELERVMLPYGERIVAPRVPQKNGYEFSGWENLPETMPAENLVVGGKYIRDLYSLTYLIDGTYRFVVHLPYGAKIEPLQLPVKDQHVFSGWTDLPETMPADDIVVAGKFEMKTFRLTRIVDGEVFMAEDLAIGTKIDKKVKPVKPGYYFSGWRKLPDTMPDHDITAITSMYPVRYRVDFEIDGELWRTTYVPYTTEFKAEIPEEREGMIFLGWSDAPSVMPMQDIVVHGSYAEAPVEESAPELPLTYTLRFFVDGTLASEQSCAEGDAIAVPEIPEREGYRFSGFDGIPEQMPAGDLELSGSYLPLSFKLTCMVDGTAVLAEELPFGAPLPMLPEAPERQGFRFVGWGESPATMPATDLVLEAVYEAILYRVTFRVDGELLSEELLPFGAPITAPVPETRLGAAFEGFGELPETMPAEDLTFVGSYAAQLYPLRAEIDGEIYYETQLAAGESYVLPEPDARAGYAFAWDCRTGLMPIGGLTVSGSYTARSYTLTFRVDGEVLASGECRYGDAVIPPAVPEREGYSFLGFGELPETMPAEDLTLEGAYGKCSYTLSFTVDGATVSECETAYGDAIALPELPERVGHSFAWADAPETMPCCDLSIEGTYRPRSYTLTFTAFGEALSETAVVYGEAPTAPEAPAAEGMTFLGWENLPEKMPACDVVCTASYEEKLYSLEFRFGDEIVAKSELPFGAALIVPEMPIREGYGFVWESLVESMPSKDLVIVGNYTAQKNRLVCVCEGETVFEGEVLTGETLSLPELPERVGHSFAWADAPATMPAEDLVLEGVYTPELYTLTLTVDGEILSVSELRFGDAIPEPALPSRRGYTFSGFGELPETMPAEDLACHGSFTANSYRFTVAVGGETLVDTELLFGAPIVLPEVPEREGYIFSGFGETPETMPANDLTVAADYTPCAYRLTFLLDGEILSSTEVSFGSRILPPILDLSEGRCFDGWGELPETMPASDLTLCGETYVETYHVTYLLNGEPILEADVAVGEALPTPEIDEDPGYSFTGYEIPVAMPPEDLVLSADRTPNSYILTVKIDDEIISREPILYGSELRVPEIPEREGFSFGGFGEIPETMPAEDLVLSGSFFTDLYHVAFLIDGTTVSEGDLIAGAEIILPETPEREGYTFSGWGEVPEVMPAEDLTFTASYLVNEYRLAFLLDGELLSEEQLPFGSTVTAPAVDTDEDCSFSGWSELPEAMPAHDLEIVGSITKKTYTLRYRFGDELLAELQLAAGETVEPIALPESDEAHLRWSNLPTEMPHYDVTVSAVPVMAKEYFVRFFVDGELYAETAACAGAAVVLPETPVQKGMEFVAWQGLPETMPANDLTLCALFRVAMYPATFKLDGAFFAEDLYAEGSIVPSPYVPEKEGYTFTGWKNFVEVMPDYGFTAVGSYQPNLHTVEYLVNGEVLVTDTVAYGEPVNAPDAPVFPDGEFLYWESLPETMPDTDLVIEAVYSFPSYHLIYRLDGAVYYETDTVVGRILPKLNPPERYGMEFSGWKNFPRVMPGFDLTVYGSYLPKYRTVTYMSCGEVLEVRRYRVGDSVVSIDGRNPQIGEFEGWFDLPSVMPDEDVVATARYKARTYCITYLLEDKPVATQNVAVGDAIQAPIPPVKPEHVFREWENLPRIMPACDLIIRGVYESTVHAIIYRVDGEEYRRSVYPIGATIKPIVGPEKIHDRFVCWTNFTDVMPAYDFAVDAVYEPNIRSYRFIANGETLLSGSMRAGDPLLAPTPAELPDLDFVGYDGYDGLMPPEDVVYVGRYEPKLYRLCYVLDGEIWRTVELRKDDAVPEAEEPRLPLGYRFSGWSAIPEVMPNHDVDVLATSEPISYKLTVIAQDRTVSEREIPFGSVLSSYQAPLRHGYTFRGWEGLPEFMPAGDITVSGQYEKSEPIYTLTALPAASYAVPRDVRVVSEPDEKRRGVMKKGRFSNVIYVSGDRVEVVSRGRSYALDISDFVCDGEVIDQNGLFGALCTLSSKIKPVTNGIPYHLVIDHVRSIDALVEIASTDENEIKTVVRDRMLEDAEGIAMPAFSYSILSVNEREGTLQIAASVVDEEYFRTVKEALLRAGLSVASPVTAQMSMIEYMQSRTIQNKCNSLVVTLTGGYLLLGFYLDGKLLATVKNAVPFDLTETDLSAELDAMLSRLAEHLELEDVDAKIHHIFYAGFRVDRIKHLVKQMRKAARRINRSPRRALAASFTLRKPGAYEIAHPFVKRRKKVLYVSRNDRK